jgi:hypothetical protein
MGKGKAPLWTARGVHPQSRDKLDNICLAVATLFSKNVPAERELATDILKHLSRIEAIHALALNVLPTMRKHRTVDLASGGRQDRSCRPVLARSQFFPITICCT